MKPFNFKWMKSCHSVRGVVFLFLWVTPFLIALDSARADETQLLTDERKEEKRLQFNRFVLEEMAREDRRQIKTVERQKAEPAYTPKLFLNYTPSYGYDRNVNLDSQRNGDTFYQNQLETKYKLRHPGWGFLGPGSWGIGGSFDFINYPNVATSNYRDAGVSVFADTKIGTKWQLKAQYETSFLDYIHNDTLGNVKQKFKPVLSYQWNKQWTQSFYNTLEYKDYSTRKRLSLDNLPLGEDRRDFSYEAGTGFRWIPETSKVFGVNLGYKINDSNDDYLKYNDYGDIKLSGYAYFQVTPIWSLITFGGYNYKAYNERTFEVDSDKTQSDSFFYAGGTVYYDLAKNLQLFGSYLYKQNYSNDASQNYSGYTISAGLAINI